MNPNDFSFVEACLKSWETVRDIRARAIKKEKIVVSERGTGVIHPTLQNIRCNYALLKGFTRHMSETGVIMTKRLAYIKPAIRGYYESMEVDTATDKMTLTVNVVAEAIEKMLTVVRRKWSRWEMPRVTCL